MMFEWKLEDLRLMNEYDARDAIHFRDIVLHTSREDKIAFGDSQFEGLTSYFLQMAEKFNKDEKWIAKNTRGEYNTTSLQSWLRKNDTTGMYTTKWPNCGYSVHEIIPDRFVGNPYQARYDKEYRDPVDHIFYTALLKLYDKEVAYFKTIDPFQQKCKQVRELPIDIIKMYNLPIWILPDGEFQVIHEDGAKCGTRDIKEWELDQILEAYKNLQRFMRDNKIEISY